MDISAPAADHRLTLQEILADRTPDARASPGTAQSLLAKELQPLKTILLVRTQAGEKALRYFGRDLGV